MKFSALPKKEGRQRSLSYNFLEISFENSYFGLVTNKFLLWTLEQPDCAVREWERVLKPGGMVFAIEGNWFDPSPDRCVNRMLAEWAVKFLKKSQSTSIFKDYYGSVWSSLYLYEKISPESIFVLYSETGLVNTSINPLLEVQRFKSRKQSFPQRILRNNSIFISSSNCIDRSKFHLFAVIQKI